MKKTLSVVAVALGLVLGALLSHTSRAAAESSFLPGLCGNSTTSVTTVGTTAVAVPATALPKRRWVQICISPETTGTPKVKCRDDGTNPVMGVANVGEAIYVGQCVSYGLQTPTTVIKCISDTAGTTVAVHECTPVY